MARKKWDAAIPFGTMTMEMALKILSCEWSARGITRSRRRLRRLKDPAVAEVTLSFFVSGKKNTVYSMREDDLTTVCPGCGLCLPDRHQDPPDRFNGSWECLQAYYDLMCYTVAKQDTEFIHQYAVDAYAAQHAGGTTRNIPVVFGLIGLYLAREKGYTGKQVQQAHMRIAKIRKEWPRLEPPRTPAAITVMDVLRASDGPEKDAMIRQWMAVVWESREDRQQWVRKTTNALLGRDRR